ncbi:hypothetical protein MNV_280007 [Candidatus Methanoperedens nitroreducens]|uniref:Uncharacterized protein n=1 Tax=Candidatus Methanoperedens nitratireducens TaxID=1392998 RepID=A0A284VPZ2_9EURY|nr:hypothetical protein MNV_280007 [Candidatus Methanoperedens nitroreducens]
MFNNDIKLTAFLVGGKVLLVEKHIKNKSIIDFLSQIIKGHL